MIDFLHTFNPSPLLISFGPVNLYWYGLFIVLGVIAAILTVLKLAPGYSVKKDQVIDLALWLMIAGLLGARVYDIFLELPFYLDRPLEMFKIWQGGLAIHGAILAGIAAVWIFSRKEKLPFLPLTDMVVPGLAIGQAIGRWGNYFNQELFGRPTGLPWGIPINIFNRPTEFVSSSYFHPTFLYESLGCLVIFSILSVLTYRKLKKQSPNIYPGLITGAYLILYSALRFGLEFIRIDRTPEFFGLRTPQLASLILAAAALVLLYRLRPKNDGKMPSA